MHTNIDPRTDPGDAKHGCLAMLHSLQDKNTLIVEFLNYKDTTLLRDVARKLNCCKGTNTATGCDGGDPDYKDAAKGCLSNGLAL